MHNMNNVDSDLEEGEILDDSSSSLSDSHKNVRELPQRYIIRNSKNTHIHKHRKRDCKNAIRYHAKKLAKLKSPAKFRDNNKKHHKSMCLQEKSSKICNKHDSVVQKQILSKNGHSFSKQSLITEKKDSLNHHSFDTQKIRLKPKREQNLSKFENNNVDNDKLHKRGVTKNVVFQSTDRNLDNLKPHIESSEVISNLADINKDNIILSTALNNNSPEVKCEESEDEEELRRIALATFSKKKNPEASKDFVKNEDNFKALETNGSVSHCEINNFESDNYEVVDMDVEEDTDALIEVFEKPLNGQVSESIENLYIIDTKPFKDQNEETVTESQIITHNSDDDFEVDILRAELIESMYRKKCLLEDDVKLKENSVHIKQSIVPKKKIINNYEKPNNKLFHKHLNPKHTMQNTLIKKTENLNYNASKSVVLNKQLQIRKKSPERIIISLNEDSSSEESESPEENLATKNSEEKSLAPENPLASIEALISDCRQKSESNDKNQEVIKHAEAVSCLSKAQQEEYQTLRKILAEKGKLPAPSEIIQTKNGSINSALNDLKILEEKQMKLNESLKKKKESLTLLSKEINSKKLLYMKSKLSAQLLKERYLASERTRKANLCAWSKSCSHFRNVKRTVSGLENKINQLQMLCSKIDACIQGKTHNFPFLPTNNKNSNV